MGRNLRFDLYNAIMFFDLIIELKKYPNLIFTAIVSYGPKMMYSIPQIYIPQVSSSRKMQGLYCNALKCFSKR